jgi:hypothetical protein
MTTSTATPDEGHNRTKGHGHRMQTNRDGMPNNGTTGHTDNDNDDDDDGDTMG